MKISYQQLTQFLPLKLPLATLCELLTDIGLEVEKQEGEIPHTVLEIGLTPNRADAMSHYGVARDLAAYFAVHQNRPISDLQLPKMTNYSHLKPKKLKIQIESAACSFYSGILIENLDHNNSPTWLIEALSALGIKSTNLLVDASNYVLHQFGVPLHAFDTHISGTELYIRQADKNRQSSLFTLDGLERNLEENDLLIGNAQEDLCIAGVLGGAKAAIHAKTKAVFIEAAYFNPSTIRKTAKRLAIHTDASFRFERGIDASQIQNALFRCADIILEHSQAQAVEYIETGRENLVLQREISFDAKRCDEILGLKLEAEQLEKIFHALSMAIIDKKDRIYQLSVPTFRVDVLREIDVIEEVLRIYGFDKIPLQSKFSFTPAVQTAANLGQAATENLSLEKNKSISNWLTAAGFHEMMNNSLTDRKHLEELMQGQTGKTIHLNNPLSPELSLLRPTMLWGALNSAAYNQNRKNSDLKLFEWGKTYLLNIRHQATETEHLTLLMMGRKEKEQWNSSKEKINLFHLKGRVEGLFRWLKIKNYSIKPLNHPDFDMGFQYLDASGKILAEIGKIQINTLRHFDLKSDVFYADLLCATLASNSAKAIHSQELPKTQAVRRDLSFLLDINIPFEQVEKTLLKTQQKELQDIFIFDVYEGETLPLGKKSYAMAFILQDFEHTLQEENIEIIMQNFVAILQKECGIILR